MKKVFLVCSAITLFIVNGYSQTTPGSWSGARPANPTITNKMSRIYEPKDGELLYTQCDAPAGVLQTANLDKLVFGKAAIKIGGPVTQLSSSFKSGDLIYGCAVLRSSLYNYKVYMTDVSNEGTKCMNGSYDVNYSIDGGKLETLISQSPIGSREKNSYIDIQIIAGGDDAEMNNEEFVKELAALSPGPHKIKMTVWAVQGDFISVDPVAMGEFTYVK